VVKNEGQREVRLRDVADVTFWWRAYNDGEVPSDFQPYNVGLEGPRAAGWAEVEGWVSNSFIAPLSEPRELRPQEARTLAPTEEAPTFLTEKRKGHSGKRKRKAGGHR